MKPLVVLLLVFSLACATTAFSSGYVNLPLSGRVAMAAMLWFTALGHFKFTDGMAMMLPPFVPAKKFLIYLTGIIEIAAGIGLLTGFHQVTGWLLAAFFVLILPSNIYAASKNVNLEKANYRGDGLRYLWFRVPLQALFIFWTWYFAIAN